MGLYFSTWVHKEIFGKLIETEDIMVLLGVGMESYCLMRTEFKFCREKRVLEIDDCYGCATL